MVDTVEIGMGRSARRAYELDDVTIVPSRRTRSSSDISTVWQIDAYRFEIPVLTHPSDAIVSPAVAAGVAELGGLGVLDGEGLWARHGDPQAVIDDLLAQGSEADDPDEVIAFLLTRFERDLKHLMAQLVRLDAFALASKRALTVPLLKQMLADEGGA